jgi:hypothetical protein
MHDHYVGLPGDGGSAYQSGAAPRSLPPVMIHALKQPVAKMLTAIMIGDQYGNHTYDEQANDGPHAQLVHYSLHT